MATRLALLVVLLTLPAAAQSEANVEEARAATAAASAEYELGHYAQALEQFEAAYRLKSVPGLLFNIAQCHRMLGDMKQAAIVYRSFLVKDPTNKRADQARALLEQVEDAQDRQTRAQEAPPTEMQPRADLVPPEAPRITPAPPPPAPKIVAVAESGSAASSAASAKPRTAPPASTKAGAAPADPSSPRVWTWVAASGAVAAVGLGAYFGAQSNSLAADLHDNLHTRAEVVPLQDSQVSKAQAANVLFVTAGVLAAGALLLWSLDL